MKKVSKTESREQIEKFFLNTKDKSPKEIKKIKRFAMSNSIPLGKLRKKFCKKCYSPLKGKTRINNKIKGITCENCSYVSKWKIKN
jgi:RNase P subunit RPR2